MRAQLQYINYVLRHKYFVFIEARKLGVGFWQALVHDWSKFTLSEWMPYVNRFWVLPTYEGNWIETREEFQRRVEQEFTLAWMHHIHHNPHHWEYWLHPRAGEPPVQMPEKYVREMVADWRGVSRALKQNDDTAQKWYAKNRERISLHPVTREQVEALLKLPRLSRWDSILYPAPDSP